MIQRADAQRAREALREVVAQIDGEEIEATRSERTFIAGAVAALDAADSESSVE